MARTSFAEMSCSIARTLEVVGEPWTPLVLRDIYVGNNRFTGILDGLGISRKVLSTRLAWLEENGMIRRERYSEHPPRDEYALTRKGLEFVDVLIAMAVWGDRWEAHPDGPPIRYRHHACGAITRPVLRCDVCGEDVHGDTVDVEG